MAEEVTKRPAGAWYRFWASVIDSLMIFIPTALLVFFLVGSGIIKSDDSYNIRTKIPQGSSDTEYAVEKQTNIIPSSPAVQYLGYILLIIYAIYFTVNKGATIGKDAYGLEVIDKKTGKWLNYKQASIREIFKNVLFFIPLIGSFFFLINALVIIFSKDKRGLHDHVSGTQVIVAKKPWEMKKQLGCATFVIVAIILIMSLGFLMLPRS